MKGYLFCFLVLAISFANKASAQCGTTNLALSKTTNASSEVQWAFHAYAVDADVTSSFWRTTSDGTEWIYVDLAQSYNICQVKLKWEASTYFPSNYKIQTSADASSWTDILTITNGVGGSVTHNVTGTGRYVRIYITVPNQTWQDRYELLDLQVFNSTGNQSPSVSITSPANNASFTAGSNITIDATAADADGTVSKVEFFQGTTKLGEDLTSPYSYTWNNVTAASYVLTAKATDNSSAITTSSAVNITVNAGGGGSGWTLGGNSGINPALNFLGTTDNQPMIFKTNNIERLSILGNGNIGIGSPNSTASLEIGSTSTSSFASGFNNNIRIQGTAPGMQWWDTDQNTGWQVGEEGGNLNFSLLFSQTAISISPLTLKADGRVRIGALGRSESDAKLSVDGTIYTKKIKVTQLSWADFVFDKNYKLLDLSRVESFIKKNKHLPGVPSAAVVEEHGIDVGATQTLLLQKIEELTLYLIEQNKKIEKQQKAIEELKQQIKKN